MYLGGLCTPPSRSRRGGLNQVALYMGGLCAAPSCLWLRYQLGSNDSTLKGQVPKARGSA